MISISDIREAAGRISPYIVKTPLVRLANLDPYLGCQVYGKLENLQVTGAFKLRGAVNKILSLPVEDLRCGIVPMYHLGEQAGVPMPATRAAIELASRITGRDELAIGRRVQAV